MIFQDFDNITYLLVIYYLCLNKIGRHQNVYTNKLNE